MGRTVFLGNVPISAKKKDLERLLSEFGPVDSVRLRNVPVDPTKAAPKKALVKSGQLNTESRSSMSAFAVMASVDRAAAALKLNMREWQGKHLVVDRARAQTREGQESTGAIYDTKRTVFVGNLPFDVEEEDVIQAFLARGVAKAEPELEGAVRAVRCVRDGRSGLGKGIAYVMLRDTEAAKAAVRVGPTLKVGKRRLRVSRALAKPGPSTAGPVGKKVGAKHRVRVEYRGRDPAKAAPAPRDGRDRSFDEALQERRTGGEALGSRDGGGAGDRPRRDKGEGAAWQGTRTKGGARKGGERRDRAGAARAPGARGATGARAGGAPQKKHKGAGRRDAPGNRGSHTGAGGKRPSVAAKKERAKKARAAGAR